jgi:hypothetical protein
MIKKKTDDNHQIEKNNKRAARKKPTQKLHPYICLSPESKQRKKKEA